MASVSTRSASPAQAKRPARLICFDLGGVLIRICRTWSEACQAADLPLRGPLALEADPVHFLHDLGARFGTGRIDADTFATEASRFFQHLYTPAEIMRIHHAVLLSEYDGVIDVIHRLHHTGHATACLSNTNAAHWDRMHEFPAVMALHHRLASHELGLHKPDPAIFRALEDRVGRQGRDIVFFDDMPENIAAARDIGWDAVHIDHRARTDVQIEHAARQRNLL